MKQVCELETKPTTELTTWGDDNFIKNFKAIYYHLNASPDNQIRMFNGSKEITISDILELNEMMNKKLENHEIIVQGISVVVSLQDGNIFEFNDWIEFKNNDWRISKRTKTINIEWDVFIKLPKYEMPQRHTIKVKLGNSINPKDMFQLIFQEDNNAKISTEISDVYCKIDFINPIVCDELMNIVENWFNGLKILENTKICKFFDKNSRIFAYSVEVLILIGSLLVLYTTLHNMLIGIESIDFSNPDIILKSFVFGSVSIVFLYISRIISRIVAKKVFQKSNDLDIETRIFLTKADKNKDYSNKKLLWTIVLNVSCSALYSVVVFVANLFLNSR